MALGLTPYQIIEKGTHPQLVIADEWERVELKKIASVQNGYAFSSKLFNRTEGMPLIRIRDIFSIETENLYLGEYKEDFVVNKGDILIGMDGDFKVSKWPGNKGLLNQRVCRIHFDSAYYEKEFLFICIQPYLNAIHSETSAVTVKHLSSRTINDIPFPLPPLPEQRAIVAKIEELFSDLDKGISDLKKAQDQLKVYRQAVLKKAFEGELTKEWREKQNNLQTAEELLEQIKEERQKHYEQQIENWKEVLKAWEENGKEGKKPGKPKKLKYFDISVDVYGKLPESYKQFTWFSLGNLFIESPQNGLYEPASKYGSGTSIIRIDSFYDGHILNNEEFKRVELSKSDIKRYSLNENEILVNRVNSIEYLGKCGLVKQLNETTVFESNIMRLKILNSCINSQYITLFLSSILGEREIRRFAKHAVNQASINQTDVSLTPIPICTLEEQEQVVKEVSACLSVCEKVEESITVSLVKAKALRQSILKKAFEGTLHSAKEIAACKAAPDYEPASVLLKKIKAEKKK